MIPLNRNIPCNCGDILQSGNLACLQILSYIIQKTVASFRILSFECNIYILFTTHTHSMLSLEKYLNGLEPWYSIQSKMY
jgi:hypothetical protein